MRDPSEHSSAEPSFPEAIDPSVSRMIFLAMLGLALGGFVAFQMLKKPVGPPPPDVAKDPLLTQGRAIYLAQCATCHGNEGRGDGPIAGSLLGPPVGNLSDDQWKHGDQPEQVMHVIAEGVPNSRMQGFGAALNPPELRAAAAYVYYLAHRQVPAELRKRGAAKSSFIPSSALPRM
jgi:cytochrome c oxidase cbb3-type subunit III